MTQPKLLANLPIENLSTETDYLGVLEKGNLISTFLKGNKERFDEIKMFSLYGEWGSGKSTLMKFLEKDLNEEFNTFFFEAWQFEKDENLALSLLEFMNAKNIDNGEEFCENLIKYGARILRGLGKSVKFNIPLYPEGPSVDLDMSGFVDEFSKKEDVSFYKSLEKFKKEFVIFEDKLTAEKGQKYNIVFIDDLDRCEPEQVLNLLSAIKLFFTYGQRTIFFCGIDKVAVNQAVKTKYGKVIKANEYLEKIFDISFSMPEHNNLLKLIDNYFGTTTYTIGVNKQSINIWISDFFEKINFTNPRRVKKVLNKLNIVREFKKLLEDEFPNIDMNDDKESSYFETTLVLYLIILLEFYPDLFNKFLDFDYLKNLYSKGYDDPTRFDNLKQYFLKVSSNDCLNLIEDKFKNINQGMLTSEKIKFYLCFGPSDGIEKISLGFFNGDTNDVFISSKNIDYWFYVYLNSFNLKNLLSNSSNISIVNIKNIIKNVL